MVNQVPNKNRDGSGQGMSPARVRRVLRLTFLFLVLYLLIAYVILPLVWRVATRRAVDLSSEPRITRTESGIHGDPLNIGFVGSETNLIRALLAAKWYPAEPITFRTSLAIVTDSVFKRPDDEAPVSNLYLFGRKQDLAFELPVGDSPRQRHHVRLWRTDLITTGLPVWIGSATFDRGVGFSHTTGEVTHHIGPDIDAERDRLVSEVTAAGWVQQVIWKNDFHKTIEGRNGGGDPWHTDGRLAVVVLSETPHAP